MFYPGNYGFIPHTLSEDGDPVDVLVVTQVSVVPGAVIRCQLRTHALQQKPPSLESPHRRGRAACSARLGRVLWRTEINHKPELDREPGRAPYEMRRLSF